MFVLVIYCLIFPWSSLRPSIFHMFSISTSILHWLNILMKNNMKIIVAEYYNAEFTGVRGGVMVVVGGLFLRVHGVDI